MLIREEVSNKSDTIYGAFTLTEQNKLYDCAISCNENANFVEIGSYCGRSSVILGMIAAENNCDLTCVDNFVTAAPNVTDVKAKFIENMNLYNCKYNLLHMSSRKAVKKYNKEIDMLFIDGDHRYIGVKEDIKNWLPKLKNGSYVLFHDYESSWEGVKRAVDENKDIELLEIADSLAVCRKIWKNQ